MQTGYSQLGSILQQQALTPADLVRRVSEQGDRVNPKSLYRLADSQEPLEKVDMRVIGAVCHALSVQIGDLLTFDTPKLIETMPSARQARLDLLAAHRHSAGLTDGERDELEALLDEAEAMARGNARRLAKHSRLLRATANRAGTNDSSDKIPQEQSETMTK